ncbi:putative pectinesterase/pectinesterase inhibitor 22 [Hibiscus syriacus]|uniref:Pectinesterase n=1 Tax=Hibiscus syriacus TaxID=106335 RepID=A0A6A2XRU1_HIBSY|nr:putative pectinesterase/pectinesterase inhibitor 22 [Hibiscus syriacus]KAE8679281.1 putative pectinesterase/pectinesterase inhibitor 22 [Hibiscus syriacus]
MAFANFLLTILLVLPSFQDLPDVNQNLNTQPFISLVCLGTDNNDLCLSNIQTELQNLGPQTPSSVLHAALRTTLNEARRVIETMSRFTGLSASYREQMAIEDCKELLDFSVSELAWSLAEMRKIRDGYNSGESEGNFKAWLSAALSNQDTCLEGFEGTDRHLESTIRGSVKQVTQLIGNVLAMYTQLHSLPFRSPRNSTSTTNAGSEFPKWITNGDQELLRTHSSHIHADAVVSLDGTGRYLTITDAINDAPSYSNRRYVIYVKKGVYKENIDMKKKKTNIMLVGDGIGQMVVTGNRNFLQGWTMFRTATVAVSGKGFIARDITFQNTAGPENHQAVALRVDSNQSAFFRCSIEGYQDTLYSHSLLQFYRECNIYGTIDFIFGNVAAVLQNCKIFTRAPLPLQKVTITAQGRKNPNQNTGFSIQNSYILATQPTYLGRPWKPYSRTVYLNTFMSGLVQPRGWLEWYGNFGLNTLWYGEYKNYGPGASLSGRFKWPGYHIIRDSSTVDYFTVGRFINGRSWLPATGVKFTESLTN